MNNSTVGLTLEQLENGTPSTQRIVIKSFYKDDKCTISPAKDMNGRYHGIVENVPEVERLKLGYVPTVNSRVKIYDGMVIDLTDKTWSKDWMWMKNCVEIADDYASGQSTPGAFFYVYRPGIESAKKVSSIEKEIKLMNYIMNDSADNLYNRAAMLGVDMKNEAISDVKEYLFDMVKSFPNKIERVYESKTFAIELLLMHALEKGILVRKKGMFMFGDILVGVDKKGVITFLSDPKNMSTTRTIESLTYGTRKQDANPLADEAVSYEDKEYDSADAVADKVIDVVDEPADHSLDDIKTIANNRKSK